MKSCLVNNCLRKYYAKGYCQLHYNRKKNNVSFDRPFGNKGEKNPNWKGGISYYTNPYQMKKNRLTKLQQTKRRCEICGELANQIHHLDESHDNHELSNLLVVCACCHLILHPKKISKFIRLYGMNVKELAKKFDVSSSRIYQWSWDGKLQEIVKTGIRPNRKKYRSKFRGIYGFSLKELAEKYHKSAPRLRFMHDSEVLKNFIKSV